MASFGPAMPFRPDFAPSPMAKIVRATSDNPPLTT
jgi:hypothetical protein